VQFRRKTTFDAGATPGLDDFERPDLKSVSSDLVDELRDISDEKERRESELADLRQELERKEHRIAELERELEEARDLRRFADQMAQAMFRKAEAPYHGGEGRNLDRPEEYQRALGEYEARSADGESAQPTAESTTADGATEAAAAADEEAAVNAAASADPDGDTPFPPATDPGMTDGTEEAEETDEVSTIPLGGTTFVTTVGGSASPAADAEPDTSAVPPLPDGAVGDVAGELRERLAEFDGVTRRMLAHYRSRGIADPVSAHVAAGGPEDHKVAYARNRTLRQSGFVRHAGRGKYAYALPDHVRTEYAHRLHPDAFDDAVAAAEAVFVDDRRSDGDADAETVDAARTASRDE
jgi:hypothetical protein